MLSGSFMRRRFSGLFRLAAAAAVIAVLASCSAGCGGAGGRGGRGGRGARAETPRFPVLKWPLTIERGVPKTVFQLNRAGGNAAPQKLSFKLVNRNIEALDIQEWRRRETDNLRVYFMPVPDGKKEAPRPEQDGWTQIWPGPEADKSGQGSTVPRAPLLISPNNSVLLDIPLVFPGNYRLPGNAAGGYVWIKAELNLRSVEAKPLIFKIEVREKGRRINETII